MKTNRFRVAWRSAWGATGLWVLGVLAAPAGQYLALNAPGSPGFSVSWDAYEGLTYSIEHTSSLLSGTNWTEQLQTSGVSGVISWTPPATTPTGCYRLDLSSPIASVMEMVASGAVQYMREILDIGPGGTGALPRNEARWSELESQTFSATHFVPAQLGSYLTTMCLGHAYRMTNASSTAGLTTAELTNHLDAVHRAITNILATSAYTDGATSKKAFYQVHEIVTGAAPRDTAFERIVSYLDNVLLVTSMKFTAEYVRPIDPALAARYDAALAEFDMRMWFDSGSDRFFIGDSDSPMAGSKVDRIVSESRLGPVLARARGEISSNEFVHVIKSMRALSRWTTTQEGRFIENLPYAGTSLEIWSPVPYLSAEQNTDFARRTLRPLAEYWNDLAAEFDVPAIGATGIADGSGFTEFVLPPRESSGGVTNPAVIVLPSVGTSAGALPTGEADANFLKAAHAVGVGGGWHPVYGWPNYYTCEATSAVDTNDPVFGTLEVAQMAVALLNRLLGGTFIEDTLKNDAGWATAYDEYEALLTHMLWNSQDYSVAVGNQTRARSYGTGESTVYLPSVGAYVIYYIPFETTANYTLTMRYSNDDTGVGDVLTVSVDGTQVGTLSTGDTGSWNAFGEVSVDLGLVAAGNRMITVELTTTDGYGVEPDRFELSR